VRRNRLLVRLFLQVKKKLYLWAVFAGTSVTTASTAIYDDTELQSESSGGEENDSVRDVEDENLCFWENRPDLEWKKKRQIFRKI
jgi:hypothetical protein